MTELTERRPTNTESVLWSEGFVKTTRMYVLSIDLDVAPSLFHSHSFRKADNRLGRRKDVFVLLPPPPSLSPSSFLTRR